MISGTNRNGRPPSSDSAPTATCASSSPISPPSIDSATASTRNCVSTSRATAPIASRMPISRVRSVTLTSMMFMMPMPPTTRLIAATAVTIWVSKVVVRRQRVADLLGVEDVEIVVLAGR